MKRYGLLFLTLLALCSFSMSDWWVPKGFPPLPKAHHIAKNEAAIVLGERLFSDPGLSKDSKVSCSSCHLKSNAFAGQRSELGLESIGRSVSRDISPLFNLAWYERIGQSEQSASIEHHMSVPLMHPEEMDSDWPHIRDYLNSNSEYTSLIEAAYGSAEMDSSRVTHALGQYMRSLISARSRYDRALSGELHLTDQELAGLELINDQVRTGCLHCHVTDAHMLGTNGRNAVNGLLPVDDDRGMYDLTGDSLDYGRFKTPSLRNLSYTAPYMHDGRFSTLREVIDFYDQEVQDLAGLDSKFRFATDGLGLTDVEKDAIIAFLKALDDEEFIND